MSAESGIATFRGAGGLWEGERVEDVATPEAWYRNPEKVTRFYNQRRNNVARAKPNEAHLLIAKMEEMAKVTVITQNIDDLHERAGSSHIVHLHGEIMKLRSQILKDCFRVVMPQNQNYDVVYGELCPANAPWRPHVVWFGEQVPEMETAIEIVRNADMLVIIGSSLQVYPAAGLIYEVKKGTEIWLIDPNANQIQINTNIKAVSATAVEGMKILYEHLSDISGT